MFKATAKLYDHKRKVLVEHTALGSTVMQAALLSSFQTAR